MANSLVASPARLNWSTVATLPADTSIVIHGTNQKAQKLKSTIANKRPDIRINALVPCDFQSDVSSLPDFSAEFGPCDAVTNQTDWIQTAWRFLEAGCKSLHVLPIFDPHQANRNCIVVQCARVIFVPNFKCAYSSFSELFRESFSEFSGMEVGANLKTHIDLLGSQYDSFFKFSVVRHPLRRAISCFKDKYARHAGHFNTVNWKIPLLKLLGRHSISFIEWIDFIASMPDEYSDPHWRSQYSTLHTKHGQRLVDAVYKLENLSLHRNELSERLGVSAQLQQFNATKSTLSPDDVALAIVKQRYEQDFKAFDY